MDLDLKKLTSCFNYNHDNFKVNIYRLSNILSPKYKLIVIRKRKEFFREGICIIKSKPSDYANNNQIQGNVNYVEYNLFSVLILLEQDDESTYTFERFTGPDAKSEEAIYNLKLYDNLSKSIRDCRFAHMPTIVLKVRNSTDTGIKFLTSLLFHNCAIFTREHIQSIYKSGDYSYEIETTTQALSVFHEFLLLRITKIREIFKDLTLHTNFPSVFECKHSEIESFLKRNVLLLDLLKLMQFVLSEDLIWYVLRIIPLGYRTLPAYAASNLFPEACIALLQTPQKPSDLDEFVKSFCDIVSDEDSTILQSIVMKSCLAMEI